MIDVEMLRPTADEMLSGLTAGEAMRRRLLFQAEAMERLPGVANEMLAGLTVTPALRHRILVKAKRHSVALEPSYSVPARRAHPGFQRLIPAVGMALVMVLMIGLGAFYGGNDTLFVENGQEMIAGSAGAQPGGSGVPRFRSLFAGQGANPPLIGINGRYYRMLNTPLSVSSALIDREFADVDKSSDEPSLLSKVGVVSNIVPIGAKVYAIQNISTKTLCAAEVEGSMRLFQRVSYASMGALDNESFDDTLDVSGLVAALELSGVGVITNDVDANDLIFLLSENAIYTGGELSESDQALTIYLQNGLSLQLLVQEDVFGGCGTWVCPEFFTEFEAALAREQA
ncbi:MAG: hypothetical protein FWF69_05535 [Firmicutes bacterium]|nr:hypothetical protein [Bacillota bacterium]